MYGLSCWHFDPVLILVEQNTLLAELYPSPRINISNRTPEDSSPGDRDKGYFHLLFFKTMVLYKIFSHAFFSFKCHYEITAVGNYSIFQVYRNVNGKRKEFIRRALKLQRGKLKNLRFSHPMLCVLTHHKAVSNWATERSSWMTQGWSWMIRMMSKILAICRTNIWCLGIETIPGRLGSSPPRKHVGCVTWCYKQSYILTYFSISDRGPYYGSHCVTPKDVQVLRPQYLCTRLCLAQYLCSCNRV